MMAGHMSGNPTQDAFTEWLHTHYVSRDVLDKRLEDLASELTTSVVAMIKDLQAAQQQQYQQFEQQQDEKKQQAIHITSNGSGVGSGVGEQVYVSFFHFISFSLPQYIDNVYLDFFHIIIIRIQTYFFFIIRLLVVIEKALVM